MRINYCYTTNATIIFDDEFDGFGACVAEVVIGAGGVDSASDVIGEAGEVLVREIY